MNMQQIIAGFEVVSGNILDILKRLVGVEQDVKNLDARVSSVHSLQKMESEQQFRINTRIAERLERIEKKQAEPVKSYRSLSAEEWQAQREKAYRDFTNTFTTPAPVTVPPSEEAETPFCYGERVRNNPSFQYYLRRGGDRSTDSPVLTGFYKRSFGIVIPRPHDRVYRKGWVWCICADNKVRGSYYTNFIKVSGDPR